MKGFFHKSQMLAMGKKPATSVARCELCKLYKNCNSPKMPPTGRGYNKVLVLAEAPGAQEDEENRQLVGKSGQFLRERLDEIGIDLDDCMLTNAVICRPENNRTPEESELENCRPFLVKTIEEYQPHVVITLGATALQQLLRPYWTESFGKFQRWTGWQIPLQPLNTWVVPTWHPSFLMREKRGASKDAYAVLELCFKQHLLTAFGLQGRPWKKVPDYKAMVEQVDDATNIIRSMLDHEGMACFDYESNTLKPDNNEAVPVSASITWGKSKPERCIAFPLTDANMKAMRTFLRSPVPKIAANAKFEERWSMRHWKTRVRNWVWDTMTTAHALDNRDTITGLDFQSFVLLGQPTYSGHIKPVLKAKKGVTVNQILSEISLPQLLLYNGLDTITEYEVAVRQMKQLQYKPPWK